MARAIAQVKRRWERLPSMGFLSTSHHGISVTTMKLRSDQALTIQAARWFLATTYNRGDQVSAAQLMGSLDKPTFANVFEEHDSWKRLLNMTVGAFEIWYSQPNKENQEIAELFGSVLFRVLLQCSREDGRWEDLTEESLSSSNRLGNAFLRTLILASSKNEPSSSKNDRRILDISIHFALLKAGIDLEQFRWITDQVSTIQFVCSLDRATLADMFEDCDCWKHFLNSMLSAFEIWYSQPNKENQERAELFGLVVCRVILQYPRDDEKWKEITKNPYQESNNFGNMFLQTLVPASTKYSPVEPEDDQRILHISLMFTALKKGPNLKVYRWANPSRLLDSHTPASAALLSVWTLLVWNVGLAQDGYAFRTFFSLTALLENK
ncbi:hypothetical protein FRC01_002543 [Tulasnella sp. 417]|nr:hypothetical protein FRC01_002543 [Tulasnella sp. 417]